MSFLRFEGVDSKWQAFRHMGLSPKALLRVDGLQFAKMLGSGGGKGFNIWPNWGVYALLCVWESEKDAAVFFANHPFITELVRFASEKWTIFMRTMKTHGQWENQTPFQVTVPLREEALIGVITRATIQPKYLWRFWRFVPKVSRSVHDKTGRIFSIGIGELPLIQQATFSLWENSHLMKAYAYKSPFHKEVIKRTRELGWYKEELFARFLPYKTEGSWEGEHPLKQYFNNNKKIC